MDRLHEELKHPEVTYAKSLNVNGGGDDDDNEDSESAAQCNKKLLGGNRTYDGLCVFNLFMKSCSQRKSFQEFFQHLLSELLLYL